MSQAAAGDVTSNVDDLAQSPPRSKLRVRFSLLALFAFVTLACFALAWLVQPRIVVATALFEVGRIKPTLLGDEATARFDEREFEIFKNTQLAKLSSYFVLNKALRKPGIAALPILAGKQDPTGWIQKRLETGFPGDGELLSIRLRGPESAAKDLGAIVDAVAKAYEEEIVYNQKSRALGERDLRAQSLQGLTKEVEEKMHLMDSMGRIGRGSEEFGRPLIAST
jgi:hypothetical protein